MRANHAYLGAVSAVALMAGTIFTSTPASAVDFTDKKVTIVVPFKEGGGADHYGRLFAPFYSRHLPGKPTVIVNNRPGGGGIKASNWFQNKAKPDGSTIVTLSTSNLTGQVLGGNKVKYNLADWRVFMLSPKGTFVYALARTGAKGKDPVADVKAMRKVTMKHGAKNPTSAELRSFLSFDMLGFKITPVFGLSTGQQRKAMLRNEIDINYDSADAYLSKAHKYVKQGQFVPFMTLGYFKGGKIGRDPAFPDTPAFPEVYEKVYGKAPSGAQWEAWKNFFHMGVTASKSFALPPKTPQNVVDAWVGTGKKVLADPAFQKLARKTLGAYEQLFGDEAQAVIKSAVDVSPEAKAFMKKWILEKFDVTI
jgi:tripartite-type tricarboxylate transporter receptor subunit TctC